MKFGDRAIRYCDAMAKPAAIGAVAQRWQKAARSANGTIPAEAAFPDCVDEAIGALLGAIDQGVIRLKYVTKSGKVVDLTQDGLGELAGWFAGSEGWREQYSSSASSPSRG